ncbi:MAG: sodium-dependent bicarbonate transport family permease, partial [Planctomycetaceae bacterium]|nr:sodium-dependent bicarbonate transport family permease [Planctomycetaceae bacterium]
MRRRQRAILAVGGGVVLAIMLLTPAWAADPPQRPLLLPLEPGPPPTEGVTGIVKSVDTAGGRLVLSDQATGKERLFAITSRTSITAGAITNIDLDRIKPESLVSIDDAAVATKIRVHGQMIGTVKSVSPVSQFIVLEAEGTERAEELHLTGRFEVVKGSQKANNLLGLKVGSHVIIMPIEKGATRIVVESEPSSIVQEFLQNFRHNLFKPLLLFFFAGFLVPILKVKFEIPYAIYSGLTIFLLIAIGWHGGEELARLKPSELAGAGGFMLVGFLLNFVNGILAYLALSALTTMRRIDKATVAGYYGSDSAGTFVTCLGVLATARITYAAYMPVMLAVMEIPGCLVALYLVSRLRRRGMDPAGFMPGELGYDPTLKPRVVPKDSARQAEHDRRTAESVELSMELSMEKMIRPDEGQEPGQRTGVFSLKMFHEVFLNPGLFLLFGGILVGFVSGKQGIAVTRDSDKFFVDLFQGMLCLFLLEMGMTASRRLKDLKTAG